MLVYYVSPPMKALCGQALATTISLVSGTDREHSLKAITILLSIFAILYLPRKKKKKGQGYDIHSKLYRQFIYKYFLNE